MVFIAHIRNMYVVGVVKLLSAIPIYICVQTCEKNKCNYIQKKTIITLGKKRWKVYILLQAKDENCFSFSKPKEARQLRKQVEISHAITIITKHILFI